MRSSSGYGPYRKKDYQGDPWHPKPFLKGNRVTFPYQHDSVVLYTGVNKHIFFHEDSDKRFRNSRNPKSVLNQGVLKPGNIGGKDAGNAEAEGIGTKGIFFGFLPVAKGYATGHSYSGVGGAVLEIQIPTKVLVTLIERDLSREEIREYAMEHGKPPQMTERFEPSNGLKKMRDEYKSPEGFRKRCLQAEEKGEAGEEVQWVVESEIPIENITGIWDVENSRKPIFTSMEDFLKTLKSQYGNHVPTDSNHLSGLEVKKERKQILEEAKEYEQVLDEVESLNRRIYDFKQRLEAMQREGYSEDYERMFEERIEKYNQSREKLSEFLESEFDINDPKPVMRLKNLGSNLSGMDENVTSVEQGLKEAIADEQQHYHKNNWRKEDVKKEQAFEKRVEEKLGKMIIKLPFIEYQEVKEVVKNVR